MDKVNNLKTIEEILPTVEKPSRYTGGEWGEEKLELAKFNYCICFPDVYEVAMSNIGIKIVAEAVKKAGDTCVDRCFAPWPDFGSQLKENKIPLFSLGLKRELSKFDMLGFSLQYEMSFTTVLYMLDLANIPFRREDRGENFPILQAGGPCSVNPEPLADFIDIFTIGDGEEVMEQLANLKKQYPKKSEFLLKASELDGVYVPALMEVEYNSEGKIKGFKGKTKVKKAICMDMDKVIYPDHFLVANTEAVFDRAIIEVMRGCYRGCRFCQAGFIYRPAREKSVDNLTKQAVSICEKGGFNELSLNSLSTGDYSRLSQLLDSINEALPDIKMSLPSLRVDSFEKNYTRFSRQSSITFAPEAGTQRLRDVINKDITEEEIMRGVANAFNLGYSSIKLYFMIGLPTERDEDLMGIVDIVKKIKDYYGKIPSRARALRISVSVSTFIPKPFTPFQYEKQISEEELEHKLCLLRDELKIRGVKLSWNDFGLSEMEAVIARGDRRIGKVIENAYNRGCIFDGWQQYFKYDEWKNALDDCGLKTTDYTREWGENEILPWDFVDIYVDKEFFLKERHNAYENKVVGGCLSGCKNCGMKKYNKCDIKW